MSTVSREEWLREASGEAEAADTAEAVAAHTSDGPARHRPVQGRRRGGVMRHAAARIESMLESDIAAHERGPSMTHAPAFPAPLPDHAPHVHHPETPRDVPLDVGAAKPYYTGMMAHGVPAPVTNGGRPTPPVQARGRMAATARPEPQHATPAPDPIPVFIVPEAAGSKPLARMAVRSVQAPVSGSRPVQIAGRDLTRRRLRLLNEDATDGIRVGVGPTTETGALLPAGMTSYEAFDTQDDVWIVSNGSGTPRVSVIVEYDVAGGA